MNRAVQAIRGFLISAKRSLKRKIWTNRMARTALGLLFRAFAFVRHDAVVSFYSRHNHANHGFLASYCAGVAFDAVIDPEIRRSPAMAREYMNLLFKDQAATGWSMPLEGDFDYYLKEGKWSCLTPLLTLVTGGDRRDWRLLELGCGTGNCIDILNQSAGDRIQRLDGIDFSLPAIERARTRFNSNQHEFFTSDLLTWVRAQPMHPSWKYDIAFSHLVLQLLPEDDVVELFSLLRHKRISQAVFVSDSYCNSSIDLAIVKQSVYNPEHQGYLRFDHNHKALLEKAGYRHSELIADYRAQTGLIFVVGES